MLLRALGDGVGESQDICQGRDRSEVESAQIKGAAEAARGLINSSGESFGRGHGNMRKPKPKSNKKTAETNAVLAPSQKTHLSDGDAAKAIVPPSEDGTIPERKFTVGVAKQNKKEKNEENQKRRDPIEVTPSSSESCSQPFSAAKKGKVSVVQYP